MHARRSRTLALHGYTLTELAVMLSVLGVVLAIGIPSFGRYQRSAASRNAFRQVAADLRLARQTALTEHHNVVAVFDAGPPASYGIFADLNGDLARDPGERWIVQRSLDGSIGLDACALTPADSLAFDSSGRLVDGWTGGTVGVGSVEYGLRSLRAWPSGAIETLTP